MAEDIEQRVTALEQQFADMKRSIAAKQAEQETLDAALLARIDSFIASQARMERSQLTIFQQLMAEHKAAGMRMNSIDQALIRANEIAENHKEAIERLAALTPGIEAILAFINGQRRND